jgi:hypothetical protein
VAASTFPTIEATFSPEYAPAGAVFEGFAADESTPVNLACGTGRYANAARMGCGFTGVVTCHLGLLPPDRDVVIHRRAHGNNHSLDCDGACRWADFQGEPALRFELVITP